MKAKEKENQGRKKLGKMQCSDGVRVIITYVTTREIRPKARNAGPNGLISRLNKMAKFISFFIDITAETMDRK